MCKSDLRGAILFGPEMMSNSFLFCIFFSEMLERAPKMMSDATAAPSDEKRHGFQKITDSQN
jgi:hypothetical protein